MSKKIKSILKYVLLILIASILIILSLFFLNLYKKQKDFNDVKEIYTEENIQDRLENITVNDENETTTTTNASNSMLQKNDENVLGTIEIDKINYKGLVYEGTSLDVLEKGVGHFENTSYFEGNVALAAHNTIDKWAKLHTLEIGDLITYTSFLGTKEYKVSTIKEIEETNWDMLHSSNENRITLITCVKGKPALRLCVQAIEK